MICQPSWNQAEVNKDKYIYLNMGTAGILNKDVMDVIYQQMFIEQNCGGGAHKILQLKEEILSTARQTAAELLDVQSKEIVLTDNTTHGVNIISQGFHFQEGDEIILTNSEHYSCIIPWLNVQKKHKIVIKTLNLTNKNSKIDYESIIKELSFLITSKTRMVFLSHVLYTTGMELPIKEIASFLHSKQIHLFVDGAQAVGHLPVNIKKLNCDYYTFTGSKWLCGPPGTGILYIKSENLPLITPIFSGWSSVQNANIHAFYESGRRFEASTRNIPMLRGLIEALSNYALKQEYIRNNIYYNAYVINNILETISIVEIISYSNGFITFCLKNSYTVWLYHYLINTGIECKYIEEINCIRFTVPVVLTKLQFNHLYNALRMFERKV